MKRLLMGIGIGAGAMYLLDPDHGAERRSRLLGLYSENRETIQDYAQTAAQTAVTVGHTAASTASTVAEKATELTGIGSESAKPEKKEAAFAEAQPKSTSNGKATETSSSTSASDPAPGLGGSLSS